MMELIQLLTKRTEQGRITWKTTDKEDAYIFSASNSSVVVSGKYDEEDDFHVNIRLLNQQGTEADAIYSTWHGRDATGEYIAGPHNQALEAIYEAARRSALRIDDIIDDMLSALNGD
ncbi:hypothetical protein AB0J28_27820 [Streptosporangium canum]|uniref:hypothetical protein n=1 Tax=Streptosporangium canum TaxID=324952 RepID=UPI0034497C6D